MNALCYDACFEDEAGRDRTRPITGDDILAAQERLILRRDTHIDQLAHKLREERVRRVIEPILAGADEQAWSEEDLLYLRDLGLIAQDTSGAPRIANPIYAEVVPRHLNAAVQAGLPAPAGVVRGCGRDPERGGADRRLPDLLPGALGALGPALRAVSGSRPAGFSSRRICNEW